MTIQKNQEIEQINQEIVTKTLRAKLFLNYISTFSFFLFVSFSTAVVSDRDLTVKILKIWGGGTPPIRPPP